jgi:hypothetical protein
VRHDHAGPGRRLTALGLATVLLLAGGALAACGDDPGKPSSGLSGDTPRTEPSGAELTLGFAGDVHFMKRTADLLKDPATAIGPMASTLSAPDLTLVNLETAVATRGKPETKSYVFNADPKAAAAIKAAGIDAVTLANNHSMDYGREGLADTIANLKKGGVPSFGAGANAAEAFAPWRTTVNGVRIAVLGFSKVDELAESWAAKDDRAGVAMAYDEDRAVKAIEAARRDNDVVIVMPHWGPERVNCPSADQRRLAERFSKAGADVIVGAHGHVLQGSGYLGNTYVAYGTGNFLWYTAGLNEWSKYTAALTLKLRGRTVVEPTWTHAIVSDTGQPVALTGDALAKEQKRMRELNACSGLTEAPK